MFYRRQLSTTSWKDACGALSTTSRNDTLTRREATRAPSTTSRNDVRVPTSLLEAFDAGPAYIVSKLSAANPAEMARQTLSRSRKAAAMARQTRSRSRKALASAATVPPTDPQQEVAMLQAGAAAEAEA